MLLCVFHLWFKLKAFWGSAKKEQIQNLSGSFYVLNHLGTYYSDSVLELPYTCFIVMCKQMPCKGYERLFLN